MSFADAPLSGTMSHAPVRASAALGTLDEPVLTTILRDAARVGVKLKRVMWPRDGHASTVRELRDWDLWGPLVLCLVLSILLSYSAPEGQASLVFSAVFVILWCGAAVVTLNAQLLGGTMSFFQSLCVLGYCVFPLVVSAFLCVLWGNVIFRVLVVAAGFMWATRASAVFMLDMVPARRRALAVYPVFLFYACIAWMVVVQ